MEGKEKAGVDIFNCLILILVVFPGYTEFATSPILKSEETNSRWLHQSRSWIEAKDLGFCLLPTLCSLKSLATCPGRTSGLGGCLVSSPDVFCLLWLLKLPLCPPEHQLPVLFIPKGNHPSLSQASALYRCKAMHL